jgi:hypothetical protein
MQQRGLLAALQIRLNMAELETGFEELVDAGGSLS